MEKITLRPSSLSNFVACPLQWYNTHILKQPTHKNTSALRGTAIHKGIEDFWRQAILAGDKTYPLYKIVESAHDCLSDHLKNPCTVNNDLSLTVNDINESIKKGLYHWYVSSMPLLAIPDEVEYRMAVPVNNPIIKEIAGTADYIQGFFLDDVKTSKSTIRPQSYKLQQTVYKLLANKNGFTIKTSRIQGIIFNKADVRTSMSEVLVDEQQARTIIKYVLETCKLLDEGSVDPKILFRGNPSHYLCSDKWCSFYKNCDFS